ncbi:hypothetical protein GCM10022416_04970 [Actinomadura keratinilytica]|uniref:DUF397 domain-containing protein n=1 Tax=Actinomadura keratinilytica TaxID=547461 RepID=A0ABP7Y0X2_9ACTN
MDIGGRVSASSRPAGTAMWPKTTDRPDAKRGTATPAPGPATAAPRPPRRCEATMIHRTRPRAYRGRLSFARSPDGQMRFPSPCENAVRPPLVRQVLQMPVEGGSY